MRSQRVGSKRKSHPTDRDIKAEIDEARAELERAERQSTSGRTEPPRYIA